MVVLTSPSLRGICRSSFNALLLVTISISLIAYFRVGAPVRDIYDSSITNRPASLTAALFNTSSTSSTSSTPKAEPEDDLVKKHQKFWKEFQEILRSTEPNTPPVWPTQNSREVPAPDGLPDLTPLTRPEVLLIRHAHERFVTTITSPDAPQMTYESGSRGIVTTAGGSFLTVTLVTMRMLRRSGCQLPVEIFVATEQDLKSHLCQKMFPRLNAKCIDLSLLVDGDAEILGENRYFNKFLAMMFSSYDDFLFLDSDNLAVRDPTDMLTSELFKKKGLVTWPDFWKNTASPYSFDIIGVFEDDRIDGTAESGQLLLSKKTHASALLLSSYYNYYGLSHYYPLFSQGGHGEGDKDTFLPAAMSLGLPWYHVQEQNEMAGKWDADTFIPVTMIQYDPIKDASHNEWLAKHPEPPYPGDEEPQDTKKKATYDAWAAEDDKQRPQVTFVHHNMFKLKPNTIFNEGSVTVSTDGNYNRLWGTLEDSTSRFGGIDMEHRMWSELCTATCDLEEAGQIDYDSNWEGNQEQEQQQGEEEQSSDNNESPSKQESGKKTDLRGEPEPDTSCWHCRNFMKSVFREDLKRRGALFGRPAKGNE
ncbi:MAG: hypothetical protein Q9227_000393 [Pyrenula ochraceoflavens]